MNCWLRSSWLTYFSDERSVTAFHLAIEAFAVVVRFDVSRQILLVEVVSAAVLVRAVEYVPLLLVDFTVALEAISLREHQRALLARVFWTNEMKWYSTKHVNFALFHWFFNIFTTIFSKIFSGFFSKFHRYGNEFSVCLCVNNNHKIYAHHNGLNWVIITFNFWMCCTDVLL